MEFVTTMGFRLAFSTAALIPFLSMPAQAGQITTLVESVEAYAATQVARSRTDPQVQEDAAEPDPDCIRPAPGESPGLMWSPETSRCGSKPSASDPFFLMDAPSRH